MTEQDQTKGEALTLFTARGGMDLEERVERAEQRQRELNATSQRHQEAIDAIKRAQEFVINAMQTRIASLELLVTRQQMKQSGWVIESENGFFIGETTYRKHGKSGLGWLPGHMNALRFARKEDAEAILRVCISDFGIALHENAKGVTEHLWEEE